MCFCIALKYFPKTRILTTLSPAISHFQRRYKIVQDSATGTRDNERGGKNSICTQFSPAVAKLTHAVESTSDVATLQT